MVAHECNKKGSLKYSQIRVGIPCRFLIAPKGLFQQDKSQIWQTRKVDSYYSSEKVSLVKSNNPEMTCMYVSTDKEYLNSVINSLNLRIDIVTGIRKIEIYNM